MGRTTKNGPSSSEGPVSKEDLQELRFSVGPALTETLLSLKIAQDELTQSLTRLERVVLMRDLEAVRPTALDTLERLAAFEEQAQGVREIYLQLNEFGVTASSLDRAVQAKREIREAPPLTAVERGVQNELIQELKELEQGLSIARETIEEERELCEQLFSASYEVLESSDALHFHLESATSQAESREVVRGYCQAYLASLRESVDQVVEASEGLAELTQSHRNLADLCGRLSGWLQSYQEWYLARFGFIGNFMLH